MGAFSIWHLLVVLLVILVVFGAGKLPSVMGDMAKGVKAFKRGLSDEQPSADAKNAPPPEAAAVGAVTGAVTGAGASAAATGADTAKDGATVSKQG